ncbi:MAG: DUF3293 domain-containing protein [Woeseiaceae bacterium]
MTRDELEKYYIDTRYVVFIDDVKVNCKINETLPSSVNDIISKDKTAALLTAWNPRSQLLSSKENAKRNGLLHFYLKQQGYTVFKALGQGSDDNWPAEESYFIIGITKEEAEQLAVEYQQNAFVWFEADKNVMLEFSQIWLSSLT